jgi:type III restriction enzyme
MFDALRPTEKAKIECGKKHFEALGTEVAFEDIDSFEEFIEEKAVVK